jgi:hypothetical protein
MKVGDVVPLSNWTQKHPSISMQFRTERKKVALFPYLGEEPLDGSKPLDCFAVMDILGWKQKGKKK